MNALNYELARRNMVQQQIRPWDVIHPRVLEAMAEIPREEFVPEGHRTLALADIELPLGNGHHMLSPRLEARLLQALDVQPGERVLQIGCGSGYLAAVLAWLGGQVTAVESDDEMVMCARRNLSAQEIDNITIETGNAATGWPQQAPYDAIAATGSFAELPDTLLHELTVGGRLFAVVGQPPAMQAVLVTRVGEEEWRREVLFETVLPRLQGATEPSRFVF